MKSPPKIRLDQLLINQGLVNNLQEATALIMAGKIYNNDKKLDKAGLLVKQDLTLYIKSSKSHNYVSRAALKLKHGLEFFNIISSDKIAIDIGCAIGGFTQVLLENNVKKVYAVDVGYGEFDWKLRENPRVVLLERTNARFLNKDLIPDGLELIVCDASFIRLSTILPAALSLAKPGCKLIALIKPQFEVKKELVEKGGIVTDPNLHQHVISKVSEWLTNYKWQILGTTNSPIKGMEGNQEFLIGATYGHN
jgi:23S rRNA (cytidine1920-2'-O)/16S rRNA (cytidine1409-2'-O)-methyltransferase